MPTASRPRPRRHPTGEVQQVKRVGADAGRRVAPVGQVAEVIIAQLPVSGPPPAHDPPAFPAPGNPQRFSIRHGTPVAGSDLFRSRRHAGRHAAECQPDSLFTCGETTDKRSRDWPVKGGTCPAASAAKVRGEPTADLAGVLHLPGRRQRGQVQLGGQLIGGELILQAGAGVAGGELGDRGQQRPAASTRPAPPAAGPRR